MNSESISAFCTANQFYFQFWLIYFVVNQWKSHIVFCLGTQFLFSHPKQHSIIRLYIHIYILSPSFLCYTLLIHIHKHTLKHQKQNHSSKKRKTKCYVSFLLIDNIIDLIDFCCLYFSKRYVLVICKFLCTECI